MVKKIEEMKRFLNKEFFKTLTLIDELEKNGEVGSETIKNLEEVRRHLFNATLSLTLALKPYICVALSRNRIIKSYGGNDNENLSYIQKIKKNETVLLRVCL